MTTPRGATPSVPTQPQPQPQPKALHRRLAELRGGPQVPPRPLDARALAALAVNPGCRRRALLDGAGVDKGALAAALGAPAASGQSQFAFVRGNAFEARVTADGGGELIRLLCARTGEEAPETGEVSVPDLAADGPAGRAARTRLALAAQTTAGRGRWGVLLHPMLALDIAGSTAYLEPDAVAVHPDGSWTVVEIKSFPILDGSADPAKVGAAARQAAVYALALERLAGTLPEAIGPEVSVDGDEPRPGAPDGGPGAAATGATVPPLREAPDAVTAAVVRTQALLVCPRDFTNLPTAALVDLRKQTATTRRQLARLTRLEEIAAAVPEGTSFDPAGPAEELTAAVATVPAEYAPECLAGCELAFHCRAAARSEGAVTALGRGLRSELGGLRTVDAVLAAATSDSAEDDPAADALRRASHLRAEALPGREDGTP